MWWWWWWQWRYSQTLIVVQSLSCVWLFVTPWTAAQQASISFTISRSLLTFISIESLMLSNQLSFRCPLLFLPSIFPNIRVFSSESTLCIRRPKHWSFSFSISPSNAMVETKNNNEEEDDSDLLMGVVMMAILRRLLSTYWMPSHHVRTWLAHFHLFLKTSLWVRYLCGFCLQVSLLRFRREKQLAPDHVTNNNWCS